MAIDISGLLDIGNAFIESFMTDECVITRDLLDVHDDILDPVTGKLVPSSDDDTFIYSGICTMQNMGQKDLIFDEGEHPIFRKMANVLLPVEESAEVRIGDKLAMTVANRDPSMTGVDFRVAEVRRDSLQTYRLIRVEEFHQNQGHRTQ